MKLIGKFLLCMLMTLGASVPAHANYPDRPVTLIVPQSPGGASDALARLFAQKLSEKWGQPVVVENKAGAGGNIGLDQVAKSAGDGYTLLMSYEGTQAINVSIYKNLHYDPVKDFVPVATIATVPFLCVVNNNVEAKTFKEFVSLAQSRPGMTFGSAGNGSVNHLLGEMVNLDAKTRLAHIPYKGAGPALTDLLGGRIDAVFTSAPSISQQVEAGNVRPLAVTSHERSRQFPKLPTIAESGYPDFDVNPWFGLFAPKGTSAKIVEKINTDIAALLKEPDTIKTIAIHGASPLATTPEQFKKMLDRDIKKWAVVVHESGAGTD